MRYERHQQLLRILRRNLNITSKYREMTNMFILGVWIKHVSRDFKGVAFPFLFWSIDPAYLFFGVEATK